VVKTEKSAHRISGFADGRVRVHGTDKLVGFPLAMPPKCSWYSLFCIQAGSWKVHWKVQMSVL